jgi:hypothetical protein
MLALPIIAMIVIKEEILTIRLMIVMAAIQQISRKRVIPTIKL